MAQQDTLLPILSILVTPLFRLQLELSLEAKVGLKASKCFGDCSTLIPPQLSKRLFTLNSKIMLYFPPWNSSLFGEYVLHLCPDMESRAPEKRPSPKKGPQLCVSVFFAGYLATR